MQGDRLTPNAEQIIDRYRRSLERYESLARLALGELTEIARESSDSRTQQRCLEAVELVCHELEITSS